MDVPSIKGIALQLAVEPIRQLLDSGQLSRQELELRLQPEDLQAIDEKIVVGMRFLTLDGFDQVALPIVRCITGRIGYRADVDTSNVAFCIACTYRRDGIN